MVIKQTNKTYANNLELSVDDDISLFHKIFWLKYDENYTMYILFLFHVQTKVW